MKILFLYLSIHCDSNTNTNEFVNIITGKQSVRSIIARIISVFLNRRAAARYRALASIIPDRERPEVTTICYKISVVEMITNLN